MKNFFQSRKFQLAAGLTAVALIFSGGAYLIVRAVALYKNVSTHDVSAYEMYASDELIETDTSETENEVQQSSDAESKSTKSSSHSESQKNSTASSSVQVPKTPEELLNEAPLNPLRTGFVALDSHVDKTFASIFRPDMRTFEKTKAIYDYVKNKNKVYKKPVYEALPLFYASFEDEMIVESAYFAETKGYWYYEDQLSVFVIMARAIGLEAYLINSNTISLGFSLAIVKLENENYFFTFGSTNHFCKQKQDTHYIEIMSTDNFGGFRKALKYSWDIKGLETDFGMNSMWSYFNENENHNLKPKAGGENYQITFSISIQSGRGPYTVQVIPDNKENLKQIKTTNGEEVSFDVSFAAELKIIMSGPQEKERIFYFSRPFSMQ